MNKKLIVAALGLAFVGAANAQSNVTIYGIADAGLRFDKTNIGTLSSVQSGGESGSRWGLRGSEDLGAGLKANFTFEQGIDISDNSVPQGNIGATSASSTGSRLFSRRAFVGLSGGFGEVRLGRDYQAGYNVWSAADPFGTGLVGGAQNVFIGASSRYDNAIHYDTPVFQGFQGTASYRFGESTTDTAAAAKNGNNGYSLGLTYTTKPIYVGYEHTEGKNAANTATNKQNALVGTYDFGPAKLHGLYFSNKTSSTVDLRSYLLGVSAPVGAWTLLASYGDIDDRSATNYDAKFYGLGATYAFSKRTDVYTSYAKYSNKNGAAYTLSDASTAALETAGNVPAGYSPAAFQVGIRHKF